MHTDDENRKQRIRQLVEFASRLPGNTSLSAGDVSGFIQGFFGADDLPEDEIEQFKAPTPAPPRELKADAFVFQRATALVAHLDSLPDGARVSVCGLIGFLESGGASLEGKSAGYVIAGPGQSYEH